MNDAASHPVHDLEETVTLLAQIARRLIADIGVLAALNSRLALTMDEQEAVNHVLDSVDVLDSLIARLDEFLTA